MRIYEHLYTFDHREGCLDCGGQLKAVFDYKGYRAGRDVFHNESVLTGTKTTTTVTNYADVRRVSACYCPACKKKKEDVRWATRPKPDPAIAQAHKKKSQRQGIVMLLLAVGLPVGFGFGAKAAGQAGNDSAFSILMLLTIGSVLLGIRLLFQGIDKLRFYDVDSIIEENRERMAYYPSAESEIVAAMRRQETDPNVVYFTEDEYRKLQKQG